MGLYGDHILPWLMDRALRRPEMAEQRLPVLRMARGEVLEIGFGPGASLPLYGTDDEGLKRLVAVEPGRGMARRARRRISGTALEVGLIRALAEALPFRDLTFDTVISFWTLCSVDDLPAALREVRRVLKLSGRFLFLDHGRADDPALARWQDRLTPIHRRLAGGCRLGRALDRAIREAGFEIETLDRYESDTGPSVATQMYRGVAKLA